MSKPEVFIIGSLDFDEEEKHREGKMIFRSLGMSGKDPIYHYIRTAAELEHFIGVFRDSDYRYLHISCHCNKSGVFTTLENIPTQRFAEMVGPALDRKRLFLSTCQASTLAMAEAVFAEGRCTSLTGPVHTICFDDSVILWTSFYHLMFKANEKSMTHNQIKQTLAKSALLVGKKMNFFTKSKGRTEKTVLPTQAPSLIS